MALNAGTRLGPYEILAPLGAGGMGEVYRARDLRLGRDVAIKVLPQSVATNPEALARFDREARAVAALSHPNILAIHDFGRQDRISYAVMELLEGESLRDKLNRVSLTQKQTVEYALQIARGLSASHEKGVVHRDLKPENVFVSRDGHVKIHDFGLAKTVETVAPGEDSKVRTVSGHTTPGTVMGTLGYMSPEQVRGLPVDHRSDIFSFGAILYAMLSGKKAFKRDTAADTVSAILNEEPESLSESGKRISLPLDHIVRHCLEKEDRDRFQSAQDIVFALSEVSAPAATPPSSAKSKTLTLIATGAAVLLVVGAFLLLRPHKGKVEAGGIKRMAVLPFENLGSSEDDYFADGMADEVRGKLTTLPSIQIIARASSMPYRKTTKTPKQIAQELNVAYLLTATVRWDKSGRTSRVQVTPELVDVARRDAPTSKWQQPFDAALTDVFQVQSEIATRVAQALGVTLGADEERRLFEKPTRNFAAYDAFLKGEEASKSIAAVDAPSLRRAVFFYEQAVALDPDFEQAWSRLARAGASLYFNGVRTPELADRVREAAERAVALAPNRPETFVALGDYQRMVVHDFDRALEQYSQGQGRAGDNADALSGIAQTETFLGRWHSAVDHLRRAVQVDPRSVTTQRRLGEAFLYLRRYPEAREAFDRGLALAPANLELIADKTMNFVAEGDLAGARGVLAAAAKEVDPTALVAYVTSSDDLVWVLDEPQRELLLRLTPAAYDGDRGIWAMCLTEAYALRRDASNVRKYAEEARKAFIEQARAAPQEVFDLELGLALAYLGLKEEAIAEANRHLKERPLAKRGYGGAVYHEMLGRIYILLGEPEKALDQLEPLLKTPYTLSPGWLKIDPNFDSLRTNPRFQKMVAGA